MRVGFDARWYNQSGVGTYVAELLRALVVLDAGVELVVYEDPHNPVPLLQGDSIERVAMPCGKYSLQSQARMRSQARRDGLDLFHSPFYAAPMFLPCPLIVTLHDLIPFLFRIDSWPKQALVRAGYRKAAQRASHFIAVSESTARDATRILRIPPSRITTIYEAPGGGFCAQAAAGELGELQNKFGIHQPYVVAAGARNWQTKNLPAALRALTAASKLSGLNFQTVIYGPEEGLRAAGGAAAWSELNIVTTGFVASGQLAALFRHAQLFIAPSLYEGFGLPVVEAMACGCAVIGSDCGSLPEVAGGGAQLFPASDIDGMAEAASKLLRDAGVLQHWRRCAADRVRCFSWKKAAEQTLVVYYRQGQKRAVVQAG